MDHAKIAETVLQSKKDSVLCSAETRKKGQVVALGKCGRVYLMTPKKGVANVDFSGHIFHLTKLKSSDPSKVSLTFTTGSIDLDFDCNQFINEVRKLFHHTFPGMDMFSCSVEPESRMRDLDDPPERPCGGYADTYVSMCNAQGTIPRDDILWDIENMYDKGKKKKLELEDVDLLKPADFASAVMALAPNKYFTALSCSNLTFDKGMASAIGHLLSKSVTLEELDLSNTGLTKGLVGPIVDGMKSNKQSVLQILNVSNNLLADKDMPMLGTAIGEMPKGLITLNASNCGTRRGGAAGFINGLRKNTFMSGTMHKLDLSNNAMDNDGTVALSGFLAQPTGLQILNVKNCGIKLDQLFAALVRGCQNLEFLDVSGNKVAKKDLGMIGQFLKAASHLKVVRMNNCGMDGDCLRQIITDINSNMYLNDLELSISENRTGSSGGRTIGPVLQSSIGIKKLDVAELDLGTDGMRSLLDFLSRNKKLEHLDISGNFTGKSGCDEAVRALKVVLESKCPLQSLVVRGGKGGAIRESIIPLFQYLATDEKIQRLDVSDNHFGQRGAIALGKALQTNKTLKALRWDGNDTPVPGFARFTHSLSANTTLKHMPIPVIDVGSALKSSQGSEMEGILVGLNGLMTRNSNPELVMKVSAGGGGAGGENTFLFKGEATQLKKLKNKVKALGRNLEGEEQVVMEDCETNDMGISEIYQQREQAVDGMKNDLNEKLKGLAFEIIPVINNHMNDMQGRIMGILEKRYHSMSRDTQNRLRLNMQFGAKDVDPEEVGKIIMESTAAQIIRKAEESYQSAIDISSDYIYEKLMEGLNNIIDEVVVQAAAPSSQATSIPAPIATRSSGTFTTATAPPRSSSGEMSMGSRQAPQTSSAPSVAGGRGGPPPVVPKRNPGGPGRSPSAASPGAAGPPLAGPGAPPRPGGGRARAMGANLFGGGPPPMAGGRGYPMPGMGSRGGLRGVPRGGGGGMPPRPAERQQPSNQSVPAPKPRAPVRTR